MKILLLAVLLAVALGIIFDTDLDEPLADLFLNKWNPLVYMAAIVMYPFIWLSERKLPKSKRTSLF